MKGALRVNPLLALPTRRIKFGRLATKLLAQEVAQICAKSRQRLANGVALERVQEAFVFQLSMQKRSKHRHHILANKLFVSTVKCSVFL